MIGFVIGFLGMVNYRRNKTGNPEDVFFIVFNTFERHPWIAQFDFYNQLIKQMKRAEREFHVRFHAWVILPDHIHWLIQPGKADYSNIVSAYKRWASWSLKKQAAFPPGIRLWQDRFWEETIRDDEHFNNCVEYIHFNPVRHGLVASPLDWLYSSFREYVENGLYAKDWVLAKDIRILGTKYD